MGKWLDTLSEIEKSTRKEPSKGAEGASAPFAGTSVEGFSENTTAIGTDEPQQTVENPDNTPPAKPAKAPFAPFEGASVKESPEDPSPARTDESRKNTGDIDNTPPAKPAKVSYGELRRGICQALNWHDLDAVLVDAQAAYERGELGAEAVEHIAALSAQKARSIDDTTGTIWARELLATACPDADKTPATAAAEGSFGTNQA